MYIGDDLNDFDCLKSCKYKFIPMVVMKNYYLLNQLLN